MTNDIARPPAPAPADPQTGGMTIRVYTVNRHGTVIRERGTVTVPPGSSRPLPFSSGFPPCDCLGCRKSRTVSVDPVRATAGSRSATSPPDIAAVLRTTALLLGPDGGAGGLPPVPEDLGVLTTKLRSHLELLIPEVERQAG